ncbi:helix-turn-helix domain-containing protein [Flavitalea antarctica]
MLFEFGLKSSLLLIFFVHGIVFGIILLYKGLIRASRSSLWLSLFVLLSALYIAPFMLGYAGWYSRQPYRDILFYTPFQQVLLLPPILYFSFKSVLYPSFSLSGRDWLHFAPAFMYLMYSLIIFIGDKIIIGDYYFYADQRDKDLDPWYQVAGFFSLLFYLLLCLKHYFSYKRLVYDQTSFADSILHRWLQRFILALIILLIIRALFFVINPEWAEFGRKFWYYLAFSLLVYYLSVSGLMHLLQTEGLTQATLRSFRETTADSSNVVSASFAPVHPFETEEIHSGKIKSHLLKPGIIPNDRLSTVAISPGLNITGDLSTGKSSSPGEVHPSSSEELASFRSQVESVMNEQRLFLNPELTLSDLAAKLDLPPKKVSHIINQVFFMNFNDFVNQYRVKEVTAKFMAGEHSLQTLLGIAFDCGFNSKSTFNRAFKKHTQLTPKKYLEKLAGK